MEATPIGGPPVFVLEEGWLVFNSGIRGMYDVIDEMDGHKLYGRRGDVEPDLTIIKHFTDKDPHWRITRANLEDHAFLFTLRADVGGGTLEECVTSGRCPWFGPESQNGAGTKPKMVQRIDVVTLVGAEAEAKAAADVMAQGEENARAEFVYISGRIGTNTTMNGLWEATSDTRENRIVYAKKNDKRVIIEHFHGNWQYKAVQQKGKSVCFGQLRGDCALESAGGGGLNPHRWWFPLNGKFAEDPNVRMLFGSEAQKQAEDDALAVPEENAKATFVFIVGRTGEHSELNGLFEPTSERNDGRVRYVKCGDPKWILEHDGHNWNFKAAEHAGKKNQNNLAYIDGDCALENCVDRVWKIFADGKFANDAKVKHFFGPNAEEQNAQVQPMVAEDSSSKGCCNLM